ncbi:hypothetical protein [Paraflavitalea pollutisoli]|uniref:hypothetical protein n=1 Tax=Paraflavitalea pollutisoli TaxID=3034143 RepID=UPI0023EB31EB|nr:hypothetical protein [Paraflavitalea sp. H1-2-19X]
MKTSWTYGRLISYGVTLCLLLAGIGMKAQEKEAFRPKHSLGLNIGHEHSFHGINEDGSSKTIILPYWGFDYNFQFARHWGMGVHVDYINEEFEVEKNLESGEELIERKRPLAPALMAFYKPTERWSFALGAGGEFSGGDNYFLNRLAIEYGVEIRKGWEVYGVLQYDIRWKAYDTWTIGLGISKELGKSKE